MPTDLVRSSTSLERYALNGPTMGTRYSAVFFAERCLDTNAVRRALQLAVDEVDEQMSTWKPDSDLMQFNAAPLGQWMTLPSELLTVIDAGLEVGRLSAGAFDIGVGDLVRAWGFGPAAGVLDAAEIERLATTLRRPAFEVLERDVPGARLRKLAPITLDLSGIAKGYGVDRLAETLETWGVGSYLVSIDGELRAKGRKPSGELWRVAVEQPVAGRREVAAYVDLTDAALATSGNYRHAILKHGVAVSHTMDPRRRAPVANEVNAATVRAKTCMLADAWASVCMVCGPEEAAGLGTLHSFQSMLQLGDRKTGSLFLR